MNEHIATKNLIRQTMEDIVIYMMEKLMILQKIFGINMMVFIENVEVL